MRNKFVASIYCSSMNGILSVWARRKYITDFDFRGMIEHHLFDFINEKFQNREIIFPCGYIKRIADLKKILRNRSYDVMEIWIPWVFPFGSLQSNKSSDFWSNEFGYNLRSVWIVLKQPLSEESNKSETDDDLLSLFWRTSSEELLLDAHALCRGVIFWKINYVISIT